MIPINLHNTINIFSFHTSPHTILLPLAFIIYIYFISQAFKEKNIITKTDNLPLLITLIVTLSILGGRIWHVTFNETCWSKWYYFFAPSIGGWTSYGVLIGGIIGLIIYIILPNKKTKKQLKISKNIRFAKIADILALYLPIWLIIYKTGCFINRCCEGKTTNVFWAIQYIDTNTIIHPTQIYSIISAAVIFIILHTFLNKNKTYNPKSKFHKRFDGEIALWFLLLYSITRFIIDFYRYYPESQHWTLLSNTLNITLVQSQWICIILATYSIICITTTLYLIKKKNINKIK